MSEKVSKVEVGRSAFLVIQLPHDQEIKSVPTWWGFHCDNQPKLDDENARVAAYYTASSRSEVIQQLYEAQKREDYKKAILEL